MKANVLRSLMITAMSVVSIAAINAQERTYVTNADEFVNAVQKDKNAWICLESDIDLNNYGTNGDAIIQGTFAGRISGTKSDGGFCKISHAKNTIFHDLNNATIENITIEDCSFPGTSDHSGQLALTAEQCHFMNIVLSGVAKTRTEKATEEDCNMGGLVGQATACSFSCVIANCVNLTCDGNMLGCIAGYADGCTFNQCFADCGCSLWADGKTTISGQNACVGGICGYAVNCTLHECVNQGVVSGYDDRMGGIVGFASNSKLNRCINQGVVFHSKKSDFAKISSLLKKGEMAYLESAKKSTATSMDEKQMAVLQSFIKGEAWSILPYFKTSIISTYQTLLSSVLGVACPSKVCNQTWGLASKLVFGSFTNYTLFAVNLSCMVITDQSPDEVGGIVGNAQACSSITACENHGSVICLDAHAGGIAGYLKSSTINCCLNNAIVAGHEQTGGIVGTNDNGIVTNNLQLSYCTSHDKCMTDIDKVIQDSGMGLTDSKNIGIIQGYRKGNAVLSNNIYSANHNDEGSDKAVVQNEITSGHVAYLLNQGSEKLWAQTIGTDYYPRPVAGYDDITKQTIKAVKQADINYDSDVTYHISNGAELTRIIRTSPCANVSLDCDIDLGGSNWESICDVNHPYSGTFDGQGHRIQNMTISDSEVSSRQASGLLGAVSNGACIQNLIIDKSCSVKGGKYEGALAGYVVNDNSNSHLYVRLYRCGNEGTVSAYSEAGGLLATVFAKGLKFVLEDCYNTGEITSNCASATCAALWVNNNDNKLDAVRCYNTGKIFTIGSDIMFGCDNYTFCQLYYQAFPSYTVHVFGMNNVACTPHCKGTVKTADEFANGDVFKRLYLAAKGNYWTQQIGHDTTPQLFADTADEEANVNEAMARNLIIDTDMTETGIEEVADAETTNADNASTYDTTGKKVNSALTGHIYIKNGKKFIAK